MSIFVELKKHFPARSLEWFSTAVMTLWGSYVILHPNMFAKTPATWTGLSAIASQEVWGITGFFCGLMGIFALYVNGQYFRTPSVRVAMSFLRIFIWFFVSAGLWRSGVDQTGIIIYPSLLVADMMSCYRSAADAYEAGVQHRLDEFARKQDAGNVSYIDRRPASVPN